MWMTEALFPGYLFARFNLPARQREIRHAHGLRGMLPVDGPNGPLTLLKRDGQTVTRTERTIKGVKYAFFNATAGACEFLGSPASFTTNAKGNGNSLHFRPEFRLFPLAPACDLGKRDAPRLAGSGAFRPPGRRRVG